jgi:hypothetical protein
VPKKTIMFTDYVFDAIRLVKLTEGKEKTYHRGRFNGEGWTHQYLSFFWEGGDEVACTSHTQARDCDGDLSSTTRHTCALGDLRGVQVITVSFAEDGTPIRHDVPGIKRPDWKESSHDQRDSSAEAMGY